MFDQLSNEDISKALAELVASLGIKEDVAPEDFLTPLRRNNTDECVLGIANQLGLPIRISLSYVSKEFRPGNTDGFRSSALSRTDRNGRGIDGIFAQVAIPPNLPMFGTPELQGYPIRVRVSENCLARPDTFVAIMAHELSHVLLASLWSPHKDCELHTDLVPILLGFRNAVRIGRKSIERTTTGDTTTTQTTTYGYLSDAQFDFAYRYAGDLLMRHDRDKEQFQMRVRQLRDDLDETTRSLVAFRDYFSYLNNNPPEKMKKEHAQRVVQLHSQDWAQNWESRIAACTATLEATDLFARGFNHYTSRTIERLKTHTCALEQASDGVRLLLAEIGKDKNILRKYVSVGYRLRRLLRSHSH